MVNDNDLTEAFETFVDERLEDAGITRRTLLRRGVLAGAGLSALPALLSQVGPAMAASGRVEAGTPLADLIAKAQKEGTINTITLPPPTWANYGEIMKTYQSKFKLKLTDAIPDGTSAQENTAIVSQKGSKRAPDVLDVGPSFAEIGRKQGLYAPYKVSTWSTIPANLKDASGAWVGDYWGVISFGVNTDVAKTVPKSWADLKDPAYKNMVALGGDPRQAGEAFAAVFAASLANGGSLDDITPGIQFFADLKTAGNYITTQATSATKASGQTPIVCGWDYLQLADRDLQKGKVNITVAVPTNGVYGGYYCQAINKHAPHPYAARLWQEFLYSDAGQLLFLKGYTHPARFQDMSKRGVVPGEPARQAAAGAGLQDRQVRVRGPDHQGRHRARSAVGPEGPGAVVLSTLVAERVDTVAAPGPRAPGAAAVAAGVARRAAVLRLRVALPAAPGGRRADRRVPQRAGRLDDRQRPAGSSTPSTCTRSRTRSASASTRRSSAACSERSCATRRSTRPRPRWVRTVFTAFAAVASQFGGVPLAFFFISSIGTVGVVTQFLKD